MVVDHFQVYVRAQGLPKLSNQVGRAKSKEQAAIQAQGNFTGRHVNLLTTARSTVGLVVLRISWPNSRPCSPMAISAQRAVTGRSSRRNNAPAGKGKLELSFLKSWAVTGV